MATPLLIHFRLADAPATDDEEDDVSAEIRAWFEDYQRKLRAEGHDEGRKEGRKEGEQGILLRQLRARFGELPETAVTRIQAADVPELERWSERVLDARSLAEVLDEPS